MFYLKHPTPIPRQTGTRPVGIQTKKKPSFSVIILLLTPSIIAIQSS